jgi:hypothetical protein
MLTSPTELQAVQRVVDLEQPLAAVEARLSALGAALVSQNAQAIEDEAADLHRALAAAVQRFSLAARQGNGVPSPLRQRLAVASGQVAAQRESLARATAALDRAIDVLLPAPVPGSALGSVYSASGGADRSPRGGSLLA